jgi:hypothetical protein
VSSRTHTQLEEDLEDVGAKVEGEAHGQERGEHFNTIRLMIPMKLE